jgi:hypothetical protein
MTGMLGYLDTIDGYSDFIAESDADDTSGEEGHTTSPAGHPVSDSEEDGMDDDYREILVTLAISSCFFPIPRTVWT